MLPKCNKAPSWNFYPNLEKLWNWKVFGIFSTIIRGLCIHLGNGIEQKIGGSIDEAIQSQTSPSEKRHNNYANSNLSIDWAYWKSGVFFEILVTADKGGDSRCRWPVKKIVIYGLKHSVLVKTLLSQKPPTFPSNSKAPKGLISRIHYVS